MTYREVIETWEGNDGKRYRRVITEDGMIIEKAEDGRYVEVEGERV